jgi:16S rRNA (cytidine1402-2'-O)-methyltransferase
MLTDIKEILGDRQIVLLRELTKVYEEIKRGPVSSVLETLEEGKIRGEFTLVVAGLLCSLPTGERRQAAGY